MGSNGVDHLVDVDHKESNLRLAYILVLCFICAASVTGLIVYSALTLALGPATNYGL